MHVHGVHLTSFMTHICDSSYRALIHPRSEETKTSNPNCTEGDWITLLQHGSDWKLTKPLQCKYCECVPKYPGLVLRPKATSSAERAFQLKQKYKRLSEQVSQYKALPTKQGRRPQLDASYCNRVEWKATNKCKVESIYQYVQVSAPMHDTNNIGKQPLRVPVFCTAKNSMTLCVKHLIGTKAVVQTTTKLCSHSCVAFKFSRPG